MSTFIEPCNGPGRTGREPSRLSTTGMIEIAVTGPESPFAACYVHLNEYIKQTGLPKFTTIMGCHYEEFASESSPFFIPLSGCIFGMVVGATDPMTLVHIPSGMTGESALQENTVKRLVQSAVHDESCTIYLAGLGERKLLSGIDIHDAAAVAETEVLKRGELGRRWAVFLKIADEMKRLHIPLSRLVLSTKGPGERDEDASVVNAVAVIPALRMCKVFHKGS